MANYATQQRWQYRREPVWRYLSNSKQWRLTDPLVPIVSGNSTIFMTGAYRSATTRRVKPVGNDLLFAGQAYTRKRAICSMPPFQFSDLNQRYELKGGGHSTTYRGKITGDFNQSSGGYSNTDLLYNPQNYSGYGNLNALTCLVNAESTIGRLSDNELLLLLKDQKLDMLTNIVELRKTGEMFRELGRPLLRSTSDYVRDLQRYLRQERRRYAGEAALGIPGVRLTKKLANLHLAYVFGVKPLLGELEGAFELLTEQERQIVKIRKTRKFVYETAVAPFASTSLTRMYDPHNPVTLEVIHRGEIRYHYHLYGELDPLYDWRTFRRMGFDPLATAWELLPWSFAIDRLVTIGDSIAAMGALKGYRRTICYETRVHTQESIRKCNVSSVQQRCSRKEVTRIIRPLRWSPPSLVFDFGANQVVTYTALLRQQLGRWLPSLK